MNELIIATTNKTKIELSCEWIRKIKSLLQSFILLLIIISITKNPLRWLRIYLFIIQHLAINIIYLFPANPGSDEWQVKE